MIIGIIKNEEKPTYKMRKKSLFSTSTLQCQWSQVFIQAAGDGQVYMSVQSLTDPFTFSAWKLVGQNKLPSQSTPATLVDSVSMGVYGDETLLFARSMSSNNSQMYFCIGRCVYVCVCVFS